MTTPYTTLANVRAWLTGISPSQTADDALLTELINRVSGFFDTTIGRGILSQTVTEIQNGYNTKSVFVQNFPITSVSSVIVDNYSFSPSSNTYTSGYVFDSDRIYLRGGRFCRGVQNISLTYTGGYSTIPHDLEQACIELVVFKYKARNHIGVTSHSTNSVVTDSFITAEVPPEVQCVLHRYMRTKFL